MKELKIELRQILENVIKENKKKIDRRTVNKVKGLKYDIKMLAKNIKNKAKAISAELLE